MIRLFHEFMDEKPELWNDDLKGRLYTIAEEMVRLEDRFIDLAYKDGGIEGLSADEVKQYIRFIADKRLAQLGLKSVFNIEKNPLPWVDEIVNGKEHANFFENRATDYSKAAIGS